MRWIACAYWARAHPYQVHEGYLRAVFHQLLPCHRTPNLTDCLAHRRTDINWLIKELTQLPPPSAPGDSGLPRRVATVSCRVLCPWLRMCWSWVNSWSSLSCPRSAPSTTAWSPTMAAY
ncbi:unnamed protein product [Pleuronectes platessa]|uniref:Uncharacterized protein n=1 Tax=Pleuronectes platessa TaxID=8262 RepID=A0A9N7UY72_PLEPL|nr:unnamed protein product [Pleuronectes platessa]